MTEARPMKINVADVPPNRRRGGEIRLTLSPGTVGCASGFGGTLRLSAGEVVTEHFHPYSEEFLHMVEGEVELALDGVAVSLGPGDSAVVPTGVRHRLVNVGECDAVGVFHLSPLAPRPDLGHVDTEEPAQPEDENPRVGKAR